MHHINQMHIQKLLPIINRGFSFQLLNIEIRELDIGYSKLTIMKNTER